ncbi:hypothetical protein S40285_06353 [Stachybotrys chlorohalonatus IBT 40285]|uniref:Siderophore biosynthesis enzyme n=1 Tax=Stachybotrys chlorohalonatus (strain IBT 40285) TaxID=1283841 RepID=A0A084QAT3_STAC4|nr:hypothetical protein S40285_06353 [Stachybotrys chlorohalonata IBT 40285]
MAARTLLTALLLASSALARTDLEGCTSYRYVVTPSHGPAYQTGVHYVPDTGEICAFLDCGGGRAPPKTDVPGCPLYEGTQSYEPSFLDLATVPGAVVPPASTTVAVTEATTEAATQAEETSVLETISVEEETTTTTTAPAGAVITDAPDVTTSTSGAATAASEDVVSTTPGSGAVPTAAAAVLASCLVVGAVAGWGML